MAGNTSKVFVESEPISSKIRPRRHVTWIGGIFAVVLLTFVGGLVYFTATRGWESTQVSAVTWAQGMFHAAREETQDAALTAKVKTALSLSRRIPAAAISVDTEREVVRLHGEVPDRETRELAEVIARDTPGVTELRNELTINPSAAARAELLAMQARVADLEERFLVHDAIVKHPSLTGESINVSVAAHVATLTGTVHTAEQKETAAELASAIEGVKSVENQLRVQPFGE